MNPYGPGNDPQEEREYAIDDQMEAEGWWWDGEAWVNEEGERVEDGEDYLEGRAGDEAYERMAESQY